MGNELMQAVQAILSGAWKLLASLRYPGTELPIAAILVGAFVAAHSIKLLAYALHMSVNAGGLAERATRERNRRE